ncbi:ankyrin repeat and protein kinase domain-containing protein [Seiridium cupressi]
MPPPVSQRENPKKTELHFNNIDSFKDALMSVDFCKHSGAREKGIEDIFDISEEVKLIKEIKGIRDDLNILPNLFNQQCQVVEAFRRLEDLLELKRKQANMVEARITRIRGNTITVFTIVTIVFLPASFMAAFLALPMAQFPFVDDMFELQWASKLSDKSI